MRFASTQTDGAMAAAATAAAATRTRVLAERLRRLRVRLNPSVFPIPPADAGAATSPAPGGAYSLRAALRRTSVPAVRAGIPRASGKRSGRALPMIGRLLGAFGSAADRALRASRGRMPEGIGGGDLGQVRGRYAWLLCGSAEGIHAGSRCRGGRRTSPWGSHPPFSCAAIEGSARAEARRIGIGSETPLGYSNPWGSSQTRTAWFGSAMKELLRMQRLERPSGSDARRRWTRCRRANTRA